MTTEPTIRNRLLAGERVPVRADHGAGILSHDGSAFVYECREGWAAGVTEAVCFDTSDYLENHFLTTFAEDNQA